MMKRAIILLLTFFTITFASSAFAAEKISKNPDYSLYKKYSPYLVRVETECELTSLGMMIMNGGYVLVPAETVDGTSDIRIKLSSGGRFNAKLVGIDRYNNLALLRIPAFYGKKISYLDLKPVETPKKGQKLRLFSEKMNNNTKNIVNIIETDEKVTIDKEEYYFNMLKTDGDVKYENTGAPAFNEKGELIGMTVYFGEKNKDYADIAYIVPVNTMIKSANELKLYGRKRKPFSGITKITQLTKKFMIEKLHLPNDTCYVIERIKNNSPANNAGLRKGIGLSKQGYSFGLQGDIIVSIDGRTFDNEKELFYYIKSKFVGDIINIKLIRNGMPEMITIPVKLGVKYE